MTTTYRIQNPATGELLQKFPFATDDKIQQALTDSATAYTRWSSMKMSERGKILDKLADLFEENAVDLAAQA
ncbi:MAG: aldehyde dehydrogenase family protein, partial [Yaniella sp.]|nr:aldehyde dehydrogenase family protein [Yaniella sp.]